MGYYTVAPPWRFRSTLSTTSSDRHGSRSRATLQSRAGSQTLPSRV
jgi:hypothetical protein